jgi:hypothetical protein
MDDKQTKQNCQKKVLLPPRGDKSIRFYWLPVMPPNSFESASNIGLPLVAFV